jgi:uncharacterized protein
MVAGPLPPSGVHMTSIADLYAFQEIDLELNGCRAELAEIDSQLGETEELAEAKTKVKAKQKLLEAAETTFREREAEADDLKAKIEPVEQKLYKGSDLTAKELGDLQMDLESLRRRRSELEDNALEAMDAVETAQRDVADAESELKEVEKQFGAEQSELVSRQVELRERVAELEAERAEEVVEIDEEMLTLYEELAALKGGRAIAKVEGGACGGCRISLPTNVLQRARSGGAQVRCSSCERILFVG